MLTDLNYKVSNLNSPSLININVIDFTSHVLFLVKQGRLLNIIAMPLYNWPAFNKYLDGLFLDMNC